MPGTGSANRTDCSKCLGLIKLKKGDLLDEGGLLRPLFCNQLFYLATISKTNPGREHSLKELLYSVQSR